MKLMAAFVVAVAVGWSGVAGGAAAVPAPLLPLSFLLGTWEAGANTGPHGQGAGIFTFRQSVMDQLIIRDSWAEYPAGAGESGLAHADLMAIYATAAGPPEAHYYDSEGHVIHYVVTVPHPGRAVFVSDVAPGAPRFRLTYALGDDGTLAGEFEVAPPGKPKEFAKYLAWESRSMRSK